VELFSIENVIKKLSLSGARVGKNIERGKSVMLLQRLENFTVKQLFCLGERMLLFAEAGAKIICWYRATKCLAIGQKPRGV